MDVTSSFSASIQVNQYTSSTSSTQGVDKDGDNDGSRSGITQGSSAPNVSSPAANVQISGAGKARHGHHHGLFNAQSFASKLDTSGLSADQQQTLSSVLSKYDGTQMTKDKMSQLVSDLQSAGLDTIKLFDNFPKPGQQVAGSPQNGSTGNVQGSNDPDKDGDQHTSVSTFA